MNHIFTRKRRGLSPMLATVILIGVTVAAGGAVYSIYTGSSSSASSSNLIRVDSVTAVKGSSHADFAITITNTGSTPWQTVEVWLASEATGRPLLYESLHEAARGDGNTSELENPLRVEAIGETSDGMGVGLGRKFVMSTSGVPKDRTVPIAVDGWTAGTDTLKEIDAKFSGGAAGDCSTTKIDSDGDGSGDADGCTIETGMALDEPIAPGKTIRLYADLLLEGTLDDFTTGALTSTAFPARADVVPTTISVGDEIVVNIKVVGTDGEESQFQTVAKVTGA